MTDETIILSYDELAERLGINRESARQLTLRKRWPRRKGNDGRARVEVPLDALPAITTSNPSHDPANDTDAIRVLTRHIERLEQAIEMTKQREAQFELERDAARDDTLTAERDRDAARAQIDALQAVVEAERNLTNVERNRVAELKAERDQWRQLAQRSWWRRMVG